MCSVARTRTQSTSTPYVQFGAIKGIDRYSRSKNQSPIIICVRCPIVSRSLDPRTWYRPLLTRFIWRPVSSHSLRSLFKQHMNSFAHKFPFNARKDVLGSSLMDSSSVCSKMDLTALYFWKNKDADVVSGSAFVD